MQLADVQFAERSFLRAKDSLIDKKFQPFNLQISTQYYSTTLVCGFQMNRLTSLIFGNGCPRDAVGRLKLAGNGFQRGEISRLDI